LISPPREDDQAIAVFDAILANVGFHFIESPAGILENLNDIAPIEGAALSSPRRFDPGAA
jgi:hypothetical protein